MAIYRYGKLQELETRNENHSYFDLVKRRLAIHI